MCGGAQDHFHIIRSELMDHQRRRAVLDAQEAELEGQLATHNAEYEATESDLSELQAMGEKRVRTGPLPEHCRASATSLTPSSLRYSGTNVSPQMYSV